MINNKDNNDINNHNNNNNRNMMKCDKLFPSKSSMTHLSMIIMIISIIVMNILCIVIVDGQQSSSASTSTSSKASRNPWLPPQPAPLVWVSPDSPSSNARPARATASSSSRSASASASVSAQASAPRSVAIAPQSRSSALQRPKAAASVLMPVATSPAVVPVIVPMVPTAFQQPAFIAPVALAQPIAMPTSPVATNVANPNAFTLSSIQRRRHTIRYQAPKGSLKNSTNKSPSLQSDEIARPTTINVPIGVSHYKPIQFVDRLPSLSQPTDYKAFIESFNEISKNENKARSDKSTKRNKKNSDDKKKSTDSKSSSTETPEISLVETSDGFVDGGTSNSNAGSRTIGGVVHKPRMIELESSYIPLTLRFSSRPRRLNIITNDDLMGQDSNRLDRINNRRSTTASSISPTTAASTLSSSSTAKARTIKNTGEPIDLFDKSEGFVNLDTRTIFGPTKREEPLVLRPGSNNVPSNMQHIIKCIFPDFQFDGSEKVRSAC